MRDDLTILLNKLNEFGIDILRRDMNNNEHSIVCDNMVLFLKDGTLSVAFQATTKPDDAAKHVVILYQTGLKIDIMEAFIFDEEHNIVSGDEAYELVNKSIEEKVLKGFVEDQTMKGLLIYSEGFNC
jgi:hypothetical protein